MKLKINYTRIINFCNYLLQINTITFGFFIQAPIEKHNL